MKNNLLVLFSFFLLLGGCTKKAEDIFDKSPDERLAEALANYQQVLTAAPNGWKVYIYPKGLETAFDQKVGGFAYYMKFSADGRVTMVGDVDTTRAAVFGESSYRLKAAQRPSLYFDTYSYIHVPADPNTAVSASPTGYNGNGWGTDFEFSFADEKPQGDTLRLKGNQNASLGIMVKATKAEADAFTSQQLKASMLKLKNLNSLGYFKKLTFGNQSYYLAISEDTKTITFNWLDASGKVQSYSTGYFSTLEGIGFTVPFSNGNVTLTGISFLSFNASAQVMNVQVNSTAGSIFNAGVPLKLDLNAPQRWWQYSVDRDSYWTSYAGFTVNGVADAFKWRATSNFQFLLFWARFGASGNITYDLLGAVANNALNFGAAFRPPVFTADGRVIFTFLGTLGTVPGGANSAYVSTANQMASPDGYYLIQTGDLQYDMVSKDGKAWITWNW